VSEIEVNSKAKYKCVDGKLHESERKIVKCKGLISINVRKEDI
jgi:hypothetical protein